MRKQIKCFRIVEHREKKYPDSFTAKYNCSKLVYFEQFESIEEAIAKEKQLKNWKRAWKINLINQHNPNWMICLVPLVNAVVVQSLSQDLPHVIDAETVQHDETRPIRHPEFISGSINKINLIDTETSPA